MGTTGQNARRRQPRTGYWAKAGKSAFATDRCQSIFQRVIDPYSELGVSTDKSWHRVADSGYQFHLDILLLYSFLTIESSLLPAPHIRTAFSWTITNSGKPISDLTTLSTHGILEIRTSPDGTSRPGFMDRRTLLWEG